MGYLTSDRMFKVEKDQITSDLKSSKSCQKGVKIDPSLEQNPSLSFQCYFKTAIVPDCWTQGLKSLFICWPCNDQATSQNFWKKTDLRTTRHQASKKNFPKAMRNQRTTIND